MEDGEPYKQTKYSDSVPFLRNIFQSSRVRRAPEVPNGCDRKLLVFNFYLTRMPNMVFIFQLTRVISMGFHVQDDSNCKHGFQSYCDLVTITWVSTNS